MTTLATAGYGDYSPKNNPEYVLCALIFLGGVVSFSIVMGIFTEMIMEFKTVTAENEDPSGLNQFVGLLQRFNKGRPIPPHIVNDLEQYFAYFWQRDLNFATKSEDDQRYLSELPKEIVVEVRTLINLNLNRSTKVSYSRPSSTGSASTSASPRKIIQYNQSEARLASSSTLGRTASTRT